jgi:hypothetical protein
LGAAKKRFCPQEVERINLARNQTFGLHFAAQHPCLAEQGAAAAQHPFFAEQGAAAQQPALTILAFLTFFDLAEHAPQLLRDTGAQVADAAVDATAIVRPPATASMVARLSDFDMCRLLKDSVNQGCYPWPRKGT